MTIYIAYGVTLSDSQRMKHDKHFVKGKSSITLRLSHNQLTGSDDIMLTQTQIEKIHKAKELGKGVKLKIKIKCCTEQMQMLRRLVESVQELSKD